MKKALITGIAGQDGSYLAELLLDQGYEVHGIALPVRPEEEKTRRQNISHILDKIRLHFGSVADRAFLVRVIEDTAPDECYHLAAISHVSYAFEEEASVLLNNIQSTHALLGAIHEKAPGCRFFFAGSSELFGAVEQAPQNEETRFRPRSMYGISKLTGHQLVEYYRTRHNLFACTGILYNHESPRRGSRFVTRKITAGAARIKAGLEKKLFLGNLDSLRDWGYAPDYVRAMWLMLQQEKADDYVIATGRTHSVRDFAEEAFKCVGLDYRDFVEIDPRFYQEAEAVPLCGDSRKSRVNLKWDTTRTFKEIIREMVDQDILLLEQNVNT